MEPFLIFDLHSITNYEFLNELLGVFEMSIMKIMSAFSVDNLFNTIFFICSIFVTPRI